MLNRNEEPRGGSMMECLMVIIIVMSAKVDTITADIICAGLTVYAMWTHRSENRR